MPSLTSCYFCGDAVGASLDEYDLPEDAAPDDQVTVTLCAGCKEKLTTLLDEIDPAGAAAEPAADAAETTADDANATADDADATAEDRSTADPEEDAEPAVAAEPAIDEDPDLDPVAGEQEPIFADDGDAVLDEELPGEDETERPFATAEDDAETAEGSSPAESEPDTDSASSDRDGGAVDGSTDAADDSTDEADAEPTDADDSDADDRSGGTERDAPAVEVNAGATGTTSSSATAESGASSAEGPLSDVSPRTYNRVVRLLQNREFPVDRADFEALATSAYELDHGECAAALDGAIEKGLLEEREGMLHRPE